MPIPLQRRGAIVLFDGKANGERRHNIKPPKPAQIGDARG